MTMDGRTAAWMQAWHRLDHADDLKREMLQRTAGGELPPEYWAIVAEADVFARLATVVDNVGFVVGDQLQAKYEAEQETERMRNDILKRKHESPLDPSCTCQFDESQCPIHNEGDEMEDDDDEGEGSR